MTDLKPLLQIVQRKAQIDQFSSWSEGSVTYLAELKKELDEAQQEFDNNDNVYLVDELSDVLWDYLNLIKCLETERDISLAEILNHATEKYNERISGVEAGRSWQDIKKDQKLRLAERKEIPRGDI